MAEKFEVKRAGNKAKRGFEKVMVPDGKGGFESRMVPSRPKLKEPKAMTLEEKIIKKIRERSKKVGGVIKAKEGTSIKDPQTPAKRKEVPSKPKKPLGGKMKKPKPGSYDYQLQETMKPDYKGMSKGGMCRGMGAALRGGDFKGVR